MKKFTAMTTAVVLAMSCILVTACSSDPGTTTQTTEAVTTAAQVEETTTAQPDETTVAQTVEGETITVTLRIEGTQNNQYYQAGLTTSATTVMELLEEVEAADESITLTVSDGYLSGINADQAGQYGGWDGWLYRVNGEEPTVGMGEFALSNEDSIVVYYGDPYGIGMQYPEISVENGVVTVTSQDIIYDENYNATVVVNPVVDCHVGWYYENSLTEFLTDENGQFTLSEKLAAPGTYNVIVDRYDENGCPTVLRLSPDFNVTIE